MGKVIDLEQQQRGPGRTRVPSRRPSRQRKAKLQAYNVAVEDFANEDGVVRASREPTSLEVLYGARDEVAREAAALLWQRKQVAPGGREAARISSRRIAALAEVGRLTIVIHRAHPGEPSPERLGRVLALLRTDIEDVVRGLFDEQTSAALIGEMGHRLAGRRMDGPE